MNNVKKYVKNYNTFLFPNSNNIYKNIKNIQEKRINNEIYINIDSGTNFRKQEKNDLIKLNKRIGLFKEIRHVNYKDENGNIIKDVVKYILVQFLLKLYPKCEISLINVGNISLLISKEFYNKNNFFKKSQFKIEENINYFFNKRYEYKYSTTLKFNKKFFENCGKILLYIYSKFKIENVSEFGGLKSYRNKIIEENLNVLTDFYGFCAEKGYDPSEVEKSFVWKCLESKYNVPPELIFLINIFQETNTLDIDIEFACDILNEDDFSLFAITILNIIYIFPKLENMKLNLINSYLQYFLYEKYYTSIVDILKLGNEHLKKNSINNDIWIYGNKWDFEHDFNLESYNKKMNIEKRSRKTGQIIYDKYSNLYKIESNISLKNKDYIQQQRRYSLKPNNINEINKIFSNDSENISEDETNYSQRNSEISHMSDLTNFFLKKTKENNNNNIQQNRIFLIYNTILLIICSFSNFKKFEIVSNDFYNNELLYYLKENLKISIPPDYTKFHILNLLYSQIQNLNSLNVEINSLDDVAFKKILNILSKNNLLISFKISFFSSNASYLISGLFKIYEALKSKEKLEQYISNSGNKITYENIENKIVNDLSIYFIENLGLLFQIIKNKINFEVLGINFDIPQLLINNNNYIVPIYKFIINILLLIDNNESNKKNKIEKLIILSKDTILDGRNQTNINNIFKNFRLYKRITKLKELNIQCQFYKMIHIKNIISTNLIILSLGDLDLESFSYLVENVTSYEFSNKSSLQLLNIKLMNKIIEFNIKIKFLLQKLFYIKIKNLLEIKLFSNIIIKDSFNYLNLIKFLKYNWIPSYVITLNKKSLLNKIDYYLKNIPFLIFPTIEQNSSNVFEIINENEIINKKDCINSNELFWILKYIFYCKYSEHNLNFFEVKNLIFNIGQFLYPTCNAKLSHEIC